MEIYTLNVGHGQFVVVCSQKEAFIIDSQIPSNTNANTAIIVRDLPKILNGKNLRGLIITGFDADHFNISGISIVLNRYQPEWIMYPKYYKSTKNADQCFSKIREIQDKRDLKSIPIDTKYRQALGRSNLSEFKIEIFSPNINKGNSSNNCSIVAKVTEHSSGKSYLITGDTENSRWDELAEQFKDYLRSDILDAPHHGSKNGISENSIDYIKPHTVLISAGDDYEHPHQEALRLFKKYADKICCTKDNGGTSWKTTVTKAKIETIPFDNRSDLEKTRGKYFKFL